MINSHKLHQASTRVVTPPPKGVPIPSDMTLADRIEWIEAFGGLECCNTVYPKYKGLRFTCPICNRELKKEVIEDGEELKEFWV